MALTKHPSLRNKQPLSRNRGNLSDRLIDDHDGFDDEDDEDTTSVCFKVVYILHPFGTTVYTNIGVWGLFRQEFYTLLSSDFHKPHVLIANLIIFLPTFHQGIETSFL